MTEIHTFLTGITSGLTLKLKVRWQFRMHQSHTIHMFFDAGLLHGD